MVVDLEPNMFIVLPIVVRNWRLRFDPRFDLEIWKPEAAEDISVSLIHRSKEFFKDSKADVKRFKPEFSSLTSRRKVFRLECGSEVPMPNVDDQGQLLTSDHPELLFRRFPDAYEVGFKDAERSKLPVNIPAFTQNVFGLKIAVPDKLKTNKSIKLHFAQRNIKTKQIVGGIAIQLTVGGKRTGREE